MRPPHLLSPGLITANSNFKMKVCKRCVLPETYPGITFDCSGVCNFCLEYTAGSEERPGTDFNNEAELSACLRKFKNPANKYDVLVPMSGGVDSCFTLIQMVEKFQLKPLVFHSDHGWADKEAGRNVERTGCGPYYLEKRVKIHAQIVQIFSRIP